MQLSSQHRVYCLEIDEFFRSSINQLNFLGVVGSDLGNVFPQQAKDIGSCFLDSDIRDHAVFKNAFGDGRHGRMSSDDKTCQACSKFRDMVQG